MGWEWAGAGGAISKVGLSPADYNHAHLVAEGFKELKALCFFVLFSPSLI